MPQFSHLSLSIASTAAVALASLPLGITPANAARVSEGTTSIIGVVEDASNAQQFNLGSLGVQGSSTGLVASRGPSWSTILSNPKPYKPFGIPWILDLIYKIRL